jgi:hypothetical protein
MAAEGNGGDGASGGEASVASSNAASRQYGLLHDLESDLNRVILERVSGLRELTEQRLDGMDRATDLVAVQVRGVLDGADTAFDRIRSEFAAGDQGLRELLEARLDAMDKAAELLAATVGKVPSETDKAINALYQLLSSRIDGMDTATKLLADSMGKFPSDIDRAVGSLKPVVLGEIQRVQDVLSAEISRIGAITQEKFAAIDGTFSSNALALTAALAAQKEAAAEQNKSNTLAITKSESSTKETIAANAVQAQNGLASQKNQFEDLKERVVRIESTGAGATSVTGSPFDASVLRQAEKEASAAASVAQAAQARAIMSLAISGVLLLISLASIIFAITKK